MSNYQIKFIVQVVAFIAIMLSPIGLYYAAINNINGIVYFFLGIIGFSNFLILIAK